MKYSLLIFDWDGTLMDSLDKIVASMQRAAIQVDVAAPSNEAIRHIIGLSLNHAMDKLFPEQSKQTRLAIIDAYRDDYRRFNSQLTPFYPGVKEWLFTLKQRGYILAIATGKGRNGLNHVLESHGMADFFSIAYCSDETASKPDPLMLHKILAEMDVKATQALMIGDSSYDLEMANNATIDCIGVSYGVHCKSTLSAYNPLAILDNLPKQLDAYI
ncbi:HAD-IIIA family hydrolase [Psychromonas sp. MME2]|uniref:HAD family hydrolase n=1 Tax=unclassified Psychromonas TaxID=2614957 RepID=UPI00339CA3AA